MKCTWLQVATEVHQPTMALTVLTSNFNFSKLTVQHDHCSRPTGLVTIAQPPDCNHAPHCSHGSGPDCNHAPHCSHGSGTGAGGRRRCWFTAHRQGAHGPRGGGGGGRGVLLSALSAAVYGRGRVAQLRRGLVSLDPSPGESQD